MPPKGAKPAPKLWNPAVHKGWHLRCGAMIDIDRADSEYWAEITRLETTVERSDDMKQVIVETGKKAMEDAKTVIQTVVYEDEDWQSSGRQIQSYESLDQFMEVYRVVAGIKDFYNDSIVDLRSKNTALERETASLTASLNMAQLQVASLTNDRLELTKQRDRARETIDEQKSSFADAKLDYETRLTELQRQVHFQASVINAEEDIQKLNLKVEDVNTENIKLFGDKLKRQTKEETAQKVQDQFQKLMAEGSATATSVAAKDVQSIADTVLTNVKTALTGPYEERLADKQAELERLNLVVKELESTQETLTKRAERVESERNAAALEVARLEAKTRDYETLKLHKRKLQKQSAEQLSHIDQLDASLRFKEDREAELDGELFNFQAKLDVAHDKLAAAEAQVAAQKASLGEADSDLARLHTRNQQYKERVRGLEEQLGKAETDLKYCKIEQQRKTSAAVADAERIGQLTEEAKMLKNRIKQLQGDVTSLRNHVKDQDLEITQYEGLLLDAKDNETTWTTQVKERQSTIDKLSDELAALQMEIGREAGLLQGEQGAKIRELLSELEKTKTEKEKLNNLLAKLQSLSDDRGNRVTKLTETVVELRDQLAEGASASESLELLTEGLNGQLNRLKNEVFPEKNKKIRTLEQQLGVEEEKLSNAVERNKELVAEVSEHKEKVERSNKHADDLSKELSTARTIFQQTLESCRATAEEQRVDLQRRLAEAEKTVRELNVRTTELEGVRADQASKIAGLEADLEEAKENVKRLQEELKQAKETCQKSLKALEEEKQRIEDRLAARQEELTIEAGIRHCFGQTSRGDPTTGAGDHQDAN